MKRNLRKALAFVLALGAVITCIGVPVTTNAAEYEEPVELFEPKYDEYEYMGDSVYFANNVTIVNEETQDYLDKLVVVDQNGDVINVEVKETDGTYKYVCASSVFEDGAALIREDGTYALLCPDGTILGEEESYKSIFVVQGSHYIVNDGTSCNMIDRAGNIVVENIFAPIESKWADMYWPSQQVLWDDYTIVTRDDEDDEIPSTAILDKDFKKVEAIDMTDKSAEIAGDSLIVYAEQEVTIYEEGFVAREKQLDLSEFLEAGYDVYRVWEKYDYLAERYVFCLVLNSYEDGVYVGCEYKYYDLTTLEEVDEASIQTWKPSTSNNEILYTDITYEDVDGVRKFYQKDKLLFTTTDIENYVIQQKEVESVYVTNKICAYEGEVFIDCGDYTVIVSEQTGYDINQAEILDTSIWWWYTYSYENCCLIEFYDGSIYFNGEWYGNVYNITLLRSFEEEKVKGYAYILKETTDKVVWKYMNIDGTCLFTTTDYMIIGGTQSGAIITKSIENAQYGCVYYNKKTSANESILQQLEYAVAGDSIETAIEKNEAISAEVIGAIKDLDIELIITTPSGITWTINGKDVTGTDLVSVDLTVDIVKDVVPTEAISTIKMEGEKIELSLAHTGDFGFSAELKVNVDANNADKYANLFYYNPTSKALEFQKSAKIDKDGNAVFTYTHASDYVIFISDEEYKDNELDTEVEKDTEVETEKESEETEKIPNRGDSFATMYMLLFLGAVLVAAGVLEKRSANHI